MRKSALSYTGIAILAVVVILVNGLADRLFGWLSLDLTEERLYSLSQGSKNIVSSVQDPITLKYYFSKSEGGQIPAIKLYGDRIYDLLREYERLGKGNIRLEVYDPRPDSEEAEWAQKYGVSAIASRDGKQLFLGLAGTNSAGDERVIPVLNVARQEFLEYDVSRLISQLMAPKKPVIGVLSTIKIDGKARPGEDPEGTEKWIITQFLEELGEVRMLEADTRTIEKDIELLILIHPKNVSLEAQYSIDQFVMRGGKLMVFVDPFCQVDDSGGDPNNPMAGFLTDRASQLNNVTAKWGVELTPKKIAADLKLATRVNAGPGGEIKRFVPWVNLQRGFFNEEDVVTSQLETMVLPWPGALRKTNVEGITVTPLFHTSPDSQLIDEETVKIGGGDPDRLLRDFIRSGEQFMLAARVSGKLKTAFPDGNPIKAEENSEEPKPKKEDEEPQLKESKDVTSVIVVADVDFLHNRFSAAAQNVFGTRVVSLLNDNLNFAQNAAENLLGSNDLISIRSRGRFSREFSVVRGLEADAQRKWQTEEGVLQAKLTNANQRLAQLQAAQQGEGKQVVTKEMVDEIKRFRDEKREMQGKLREIRRYLREDIERLGNRLFVLNTFGVPILLIAFALVIHFGRSKKARPD